MNLPANPRSLLLLSAGAIIVLLCVVIVLQSEPAGPKSSEKSAGSHNPAGSPPNRGATPLASESVDWDAKVEQAQRNDYAKLMRSALHISDPKRRQDVVTALALKWMNTDLISFITFLDEIDAQEITDRHSWAILAPALMEALPQVGDRTALSSYLKEVVQRLVSYQATQDPAGMLRWAQEWLDSDSLQFALATLAPYLFKTNPAQAWESFAQITSPLYRTQAIEQITEIWAATEPQQAIAWVKQLPTRNERARGMNSALKTLALTQPAEAAEQLSTFSSDAQTEYQGTVKAEMAANGISPTDPAANPYTEEGMEGAAAAAPNSPDLEFLQEAAAVIGHKLAAMDPASAVSLANSVSDPRLKGQLLQASLVSWSRQNPEAAVDYYLGSELGNAAAASMFKIWAGQNPTAAATKAISVTDTSIRTEALQGAVSGWAAKANTKAVGQWIDSLSNSTDRDIANTSLVNSLIASQPADAFSRALQISNSSLREKALTSAYTRLAATKPALAQTLLSQSRLNANEMAALQRVNNSISTSVR